MIKYDAEEIETQRRKRMGDRMRKQRKLRKYTQERVAALIGITCEFYARLERGQGNPGVTVLVRIAEALQISTDELLGLDHADRAVFSAPTADDDPAFTRFRRRYERKATTALLAALTAVVRLWPGEGGLK